MLESCGGKGAIQHTSTSIERTVWPVLSVRSVMSEKAVRLVAADNGRGRDIGPIMLPISGVVGSDL